MQSLKTKRSIRKMNKIKKHKKLYAFSAADFFTYVCNGDIFDELIDDDACAISISDPDDPKHVLDGTADNVLNVDFGDDDSMTAEQAEQIVDFINRNIGKNFYIHCSAGKSRSQGVVRYMLDVYPDIEWETRQDNPCITPNYHVVCMLKRVAMKNDRRTNDTDGHLKLTYDFSNNHLSIYIHYLNVEIKQVFSKMKLNHVIKKGMTIDELSELIIWAVIEKCAVDKDIFKRKHSDELNECQQTIIKLMKEYIHEDN